LQWRGGSQAEFPRCGCYNALVKPKATHLGTDFGAQWHDRAMAAAYRHRPPYPPEIFEHMKTLALPGPVLEIGAGTGDAPIELARWIDQVDAVEPSAEMLRVAAGRADRHVRWIHATFEEAELYPPYGLAVAAESLHWTQWDVSPPRIARALAPGAVLVILERMTVPPRWADELAGALSRYSTNRDYKPCNLVEELCARTLFHVSGAIRTDPGQCLQPVADYVESFHSRNGFSRDRMTREDAAAFDAALRKMVQRHLREGLVPVATYVAMHWGRPTP
jgi:SAM-dependent methyltransferase